MTCDHRHPPRLSPAFTLVELLLALVLSAFIGSAILVMLGAATSATGAQADSRRATLSRQVAAERLGSLIRAARGPLWSSPDQLLLWVEDRNGNDAPELSELRLIRWSDAEDRVEVSEAVSGSPPNPDSSYSLQDNLAAVAAVVASTLPSRALLRHITAFSVSLDATDARSAKRVRIQVALVSDQGTDTATIIATPRGEQ